MEERIIFPIIFCLIILLFFGGNIYEWWGLKKFNEKLFTLGFCVLKFNESRFKSLPPPGEIIQTASGHYKVINENQLLFRYDYKFFDFRFKTPFPLKGSVVITDGQALITARTPLVMSIFAIFWLLGWTALNALAAYKSEIKIEPVFFLLMGWIFFLIMIYVSLYVEKKRLLKVLDEVLR